MAAAAQADRQEVGHAEQRAHAAHLDDGVGLAREAAAAAARRRWSCRRHRSPWRRPALRERRRRASSWWRPTRRNRPGGAVPPGLRHRAVVLGEEERRRDAARRSPARRRAIVSRARSISAALSRAAFSRSSSPMRPRSRRAGDRGVRASPAATSSAARLLVAGIERREDDEIATDVRPAAASRWAAARDRRVVERHERAAVVLVAALDHPHPAAHQAGQVLRPVAERRQRGRGRQADAQRGDLASGARRWTTALVKCVVPIITASMRFAPAPGTGRAEARRAREDAGGDVLAGRRLHRARPPCRPRSGRRRCWCRRRRCRCVSCGEHAPERRGRSRRRAGRHARGPSA